MRVINFEDKYKEQVVKLLEAFQLYLVEIDPLKRLRLVPGYAEKYVDRIIKEVGEKKGLFLLAMEDDKVVGLVVGIIDKISVDDLLGVISTSMPGRITELYVDPQFRGNGFATDLIKEVENYFRQKGCDVSKVEVFYPNELAKSLYKRLGYEPRDIDNIKKL